MQLAYAFSKRSDVYLLADTNEVDGGYALPTFMGAKGTQRALTFGARHRF